MDCTFKRKYIDDLGIEFVDTPQGWNTNTNDKRMPYWLKQREEYGFDERETWDLSYAFMLWLYERLMMYDKVNCVDTKSSLHQFDYKGEILNFQDCIDKMIEGSKLYLTKKYINLTDEDVEKIKDVLNIFALCFNCLWW